MLLGLQNRAKEALQYLKATQYHRGREKSREIEEKLRTNGFTVQVFPSKFDKTMGFIFAHNKRFY